MPVYSYQQIRQLTAQSGYSGTQADAVAHYLYTNQTNKPTGDKPKNDPQAAYESLANRIGKISLGGILLIVGLLALLREPAVAALSVVGKVNPAVGAVAGVENIRTARATRRLRQVETARATHELERSRAASVESSPTRLPTGGSLGEQPGNEPTTGGRPVKTTATPKVKQPRSAEAIAWQRYQREQRKANPNPTAAYETWKALATPEEVARRQSETIKRNNERSAGERETPQRPPQSAAAQRAQEIRQARRKRERLPVGRTRKKSVPEGAFKPGEVPKFWESMRGKSTDDIMRELRGEEET